ncbi:MAG: hypothetical protein KatS3mg068_1405 [Candidatus Sericytochromatia bacterium]|nr:MAG: hypothetical protein KatS3mg068_1405 [Candidatus Sericytochromatia bacterium]
MFEENKPFPDRLNSFIDLEKNNILELKRIQQIVNDKDIEAFIKKRENYLNFLLMNMNDVKKIEKDFFLNIETLRRDSLNLSKRNQKLWFSKLFENNFEDLKKLLKVILVSQNYNDFIIVDKIVSELEKLRYGNYK